MRQIIVILGQTATGKSALAVKIALRLRRGLSAPKINGEIISADSRQVYKEIPIGTLTDILNNQANISREEFFKYY